MSLRPTLPGDLPGLTAFLRDRIESSMFLLSNLAAHGLGGAHPNALRRWVAGDPLAGVAGLTNGGMILPQWPGGDWPVLRPLILRRAVAGIVGEASQVAALRRGLGLGAAPARMATDEQGFALDLVDLRLPDAVQVGGVFTPPGLRGQGHARRAVGLHLAEARAAGAVRAFLFAAHPAAIRAYAALGVAPRGRIALVLFQAPAEVRP